MHHSDQAIVAHNRPAGQPSGAGRGKQDANALDSFHFRGGNCQVGLLRNVWKSGDCHTLPHGGWRDRRCFICTISRDASRLSAGKLDHEDVQHCVRRLKRHRSEARLPRIKQGNPYAPSHNAEFATRAETIRQRGGILTGHDMKASHQPRRNTVGNEKPGARHIAVPQWNRIWQTTSRHQCPAAASQHPERPIKNHLVVTHEVAKVQGGDTPEGVPYGLAKGGTRHRTRPNIIGRPICSRGCERPFSQKDQPFRRSPGSMRASTWSRSRKWWRSAAAMWITTSAAIR